MTAGYRPNVLGKYYGQKVDSSTPLLQNHIVDFLRRSGLKAERLLDVGCGDGGFTEKMGKVVGSKEIHGVDISDVSVRLASGRISVTRTDLNDEGLSYPDEYFDIVTCIEVIEHLIDTDNLLAESFRVLRSKGHFLVTAPNLASWGNRILLLFGYQPFFSEVSLHSSNFGYPKLKSTVSQETSAHLRMYTLRALKEQLEFHGFRIFELVGAYPDRQKRILTFFDKMFKVRPGLATTILVLSQKP